MARDQDTLVPLNAEVDKKRMEDAFQVGDLDPNKLLAEWRWLCEEPLELIARNAFGDLFLINQAREIFQLEVSAGRFTKVASSKDEFFALCDTPQKKEEWFAESEEKMVAAKGLRPAANQCVAFTVPLVFAESRSDNAPWVADLYEHLSFLGDLHRQISDVPDGGKIRLHLKPNPSE
jgi:hypothetical protein